MNKGHQTQLIMKSTMPHTVWAAYRLSCDKFSLRRVVMGFGGFGRV